MAIADSTTYLKAVVDALKTEWPANKTINIVFHGHSVPAGFFKTPIVDTFHAYPHLVHQGIKELFPFAVVNAIVTAIGGEMSLSGAARFERDVLSLRPSVIVLDYALNDRGVGLEAAKNAWTEMIVAATRRQIPIILCTPTGDLTTVRDLASDPLVKHTQQIRALAAQHTTGLADVFMEWDAAILRHGVPALHSQVNHPSYEGHKVAAAAIMPWFSKPTQPSK